jgi:quinol monooxygenase YgiN
LGREAGHLRELVCRLKCIKDCGKPRVEHPVQRKHINLHGKYDINYGDPANSEFDYPPLKWHLSSINHSGDAMYSVALFARLEAKPGKEAAVAQFLKQGLVMANAEATTPLWFALRLGPSTFGVFDAFTDESGRQAHLNGPIAKALMGVAAELFAKPPAIESIEVLGAKLPGRN